MKSGVKPIRLKVAAAVGGVLVLLAGLRLLDAGQKSPAAEVIYQQVVTSAAEPQPFYEVERHYSGRVIATQASNVGLEQAGRVVAVLADEGQQVRQGDLLARLDDQLLQQDVASVRAQLTEAEAELALNRKTYQRLQSLKTQGFAAQQQMDELEAQQQVLQAAIVRLNSAAAALAIRLQQTRLYAPYDAVITRRYADEGRVMAAGEPLLQLQQQGNREVDIGVPPALRPQFQLQQNLPVIINGQTYPAKLISIGEDLHPQTRTVQLRLALEHESPLVTGELARLLLRERVEKRVFRVPAAAVTDGPRGMWAVYLVAPGTDGLATVSTRQVRIEHAEDDAFFVSGNIQPGEHLVTQGLQRIVPGQTVRVLNQAPRVSL